ncbi:hypothetical protein [Ponticaulis sp.]|uniref:hypothetical protein n=1 Tax=Ponticaulis sp. TaxID=2020902 RepID=UPI000C693D9D|nr:hypothetical protein [Ponticaulis sp.]MAJ10656.1 hypothetical protein [Ponticaulis sp.]HBH88645.1 hypothetical protein [Hyphomonadaceae bacterium]HBJ93353.1 hypothetical protein [Hyphomonadaceae bacterium]|tara:strand:- start:1627 stop:2268 length:642 start_codon:yes stop_codon:yes gene_type:complete
MIRKFCIFAVISAFSASGLLAWAQSDAVTGVFPRERILTQAIGDGNISLSMEYTRIAYQLEQAGYVPDASTDPRELNFLAQEPKLCELGGRAPTTLSFAYTRRQDDGYTGYILNWAPDAEGRYVPTRIQYVLRTERPFGRAHFYQFIPGMERGASLEPFCGESRPRSCNVFSVPERQIESLRYADTRIYMNHQNDSVQAERLDMPEPETICRF